MPGAVPPEMDDDILPPAKRARLEALDDDDDDEARFDADDFYDEPPEQSNPSASQSGAPLATKSTLSPASHDTGGFHIPGLGSLSGVGVVKSTSLVIEEKWSSSVGISRSAGRREDDSASPGSGVEHALEETLESELRYFAKTDDIYGGDDAKQKKPAHIPDLSPSQIPGLGKFPSPAPGSSAYSPATNRRSPTTTNTGKDLCRQLEEKEPGELDDDYDESFPFSDGDNRDGSAKATINPSKERADLDEAFLRAGKENQGKENAEWQLDSDPEPSDSSSDSSSDDDSDDSDAEEGELLTAEEQARILMKGEIDQDGGPAEDAILRTQNEQADEQYKRPEVVVTPEMKITQLGLVESVVGNLALIKGFTSGEFQVLESGSVLCLEDRTVIGAVAEPIGRVHEPRYSVGFALASEIAERGITKGTKVFYVDQHSTYVFTQPLRNFKGTDASNQHDEEVGEEEIEFSDDEKEAEYKRNVKAARKAARGEQPNARGAQKAAAEAPRSAQQPSQPVALDYDDEGETDMYTPLRRPTDYHNMVGPQAGAVQEHRSPYRNPKGRGGHGGHGGHGHSDRGRADRGRGGRFDRGGRGGRFNDNHGKHDGPHHGRNQNRHEKRGKRFENNHRHDRPSGNQQSPPRYDPVSPREGVQASRASPLPKSQGSSTHQFPSGYPPVQGMQVPPPFPAQSGAAPIPGSVSFPFPFPPVPPAAPANLPAGAFVNPAFFLQQAAAQASPPNPQNPPAAGGWNIQQVLQQLSQQSAAFNPGTPPPPPSTDPRRRR